MYGTPTMHIDMVNLPNIDEYPLNSLRMAVTAGAICPEELVRQMKAKYTVDKVTSVYGLTETSPAAFASLDSDDDTLRSTTVGYPLEHTEIKLVDKEGRVVPIGTEGEMCMRGYLLMQGYWQDPQKTQEAIDPARWFHSGDLCIMNATGHSRVVGRLKDMIIRGGENIYPREIEDFLHTHPDIVEAQVFGIPDKRLGEAVAAWIRPKEGKTITAEEVKVFCKGQISHFKIPQYMTFTTNFPTTTSGKIQKFVMRAQTIKDLNLE
jgi:fatty-acyl-CoA synthase